ncbi:MAG TPA: cysteine hydrolase family protein [Acidimicrobiales bacterium]|nr:cysteine hydrolase family protein [Acidimicrobiales bacterium]
MSDPTMDPTTTAVVLIGFQNDFFADDGALRSVFEDPAGATNALATTVELVERMTASAATVVNAPIAFSEGYAELVDPVGVLAAIRDAGAFRTGTAGASTVDELESFGDRIQEVPGRRGMDAFSNTRLDEVLTEAGVTDVVLTGALTSVCVDSTARSAVERGYRVTVVRDCVVGRTAFEHAFFCDNIFPMYAEVLDAADVLGRIGSQPS